MRYIGWIQEDWWGGRGLQGLDGWGRENWEMRVLGEVRETWGVQCLPQK